MEMMVALLLGAVIITPLYIITRGMSEATTKRQMETEAIQRARFGLELLASDLQRAGMMVSPNPERDPESIVQNQQHAFYRRAVVHLNRAGDDQFDSILVTGNLVSSTTYTAYIGADTAGDTLLLNEWVDSPEECAEEFSPSYAYTHITTSTGQGLDAKIDPADSAVTCLENPPDGSSAPDELPDTACRCRIQLAAGEMILDGPGGFSEGQQVFVQGNQSALYRVEPVVEERDIGAGETCDAVHYNLVRYFIDYDAVNPAALGGSTCSLSDIGDELIDFDSAKVVAEYVEDFQVWFRTVRTGNSSVIRPNYHSPSDLGASSGFAPCEADPIVGETPSCEGAGTTHLACGLDSSDFGPEHVRSALVRLGVRTEKSDTQMSFTTDPTDPDAGVPLTGVVRYNVAVPPGPDDDTRCFEPGMWKVRTLVTEVPMPNLAARVASFTDDVPDF